MLHAVLERMWLESSFADLRYLLTARPAGDARFVGDDSDRWQVDTEWVWPSGDPRVDLHLLPVYSFTEFTFARVSRFAVPYDPARSLADQFGEAALAMTVQCVRGWLAPAVAQLTGEVGAVLDPDHSTGLTQLSAGTNVAVNNPNRTEHTP